MSDKAIEDVNKAERLEVIRHSAAHIMAEAVLSLFPDAKFGIGPATDDGFYYDFELPRPLVAEDLPIIEAKMKEIIAADFPFIKKEIDKIIFIAKLLHMFSIVTIIIWRPKSTLYF